MNDNDTQPKVRGPIVHICQDNPNHAFWPAERFGTLRHCLPFRGDNKMEYMIPRLRTALLDFDATQDFLLLSGAPLACGVAFAILHERFDAFTVLRWSVPVQDYVVTPINLLQSALPNGDSDYEQNAARA